MQCAWHEQSLHVEPSWPREGPNRSTHGRHMPTYSAAARGHRPQRPTHGRHSTHPTRGLPARPLEASRREPAPVVVALAPVVAIPLDGVVALTLALHALAPVVAIALA